MWIDLLDAVWKQVRVQGWTTASLHNVKKEVCQVYIHPRNSLVNNVFVHSICILGMCCGLGLDFGIYRQTDRQTSLHAGSQRSDEVLNGDTGRKSSRYI